MRSLRSPFLVHRRQGPLIAFLQPLSCHDREVLRGEKRDGCMTPGLPKRLKYPLPTSIGHMADHKEQTKIQASGGFPF